MTDLTAAHRGSYFAEGAHLRTDPATGVARDRSGARVLSLTEDFLRGLRAAFRDECGAAAEAVLKTCGRTWGRQFADRFDRELSEFYGLPVGELTVAFFQVSLEECFRQHGWGTLTLDLSLQERGLLLASVDGAGLSGPGDKGPAGDPLLAGVLAAVFSHFAGEELDCVQTQVPAEEGGTSRFVVGLPARLEAVAEKVAGGAGHDELVAELAEWRA